MTDPRFTDPRNDPMLRDDDNIRGTWGWIAGIAILALIAFVVVAGWNSNPNTASNNAPAPMSTGSAPRNAAQPSTTGSGATSPQPARPAPAAPNPAPATPNAR